MSELELTPTEPASTQHGLLRRIFRPKDIGFYLMLLLAWIGAAYTQVNAESSRWYWHALIPIFGLICIITEWSSVEPTAKARALLVVRQILHWGGLLLVIQLAFIATSHGFMNALDARQASLMLMLTVTLSTFLAGIHFDWRLCFVAIFLGAGALLMVMVQNLIPSLIYLVIGTIIVYLAWTWLYRHWRALHQPS
ncbi:MAG: hypothetical protein IAF00_00580 [Phycisphaerales bacterium]|nr:hypothetical protein [Phycisphaerales bacterium]